MASSASVYGMADAFPTTEGTEPLQQPGPSRRGRRASGKACWRSFKRDVRAAPTWCSGYFNVYGPRMDIHGKYTEVLIRWMDRLGAPVCRRSFSVMASRPWTWCMFEGCGASECPGGDLLRLRRRAQRGQRRGNLPARTCPGASTGHGQAGRAARFAAGAERESRSAPACGSVRGARPDWLQGKHSPDGGARGTGRTWCAERDAIAPLETTP